MRMNTPQNLKKASCLVSLNICLGPSNDLKLRYYLLTLFDAFLSHTKLQNPDREYSIGCSYLEIYNEQIKDLLCPSSVSLQIREDSKKGIYVENLCVESANNADDMFRLLCVGAQNRQTKVNNINQFANLCRHIGSTLMNTQSSRSHAVFTLNITTTEYGKTKFARLHIIDLAGSESQKKTETSGLILKITNI